MPIPLFLTAGGSVSFESVTPDYDTADGYSGLLELINGQAKVSLASSSTEGTTHTFTATSTATAAWQAGRYSWRLSAVKSGEKWPISEGELEIRPDLGAATTLDARGHIRKVLDAVEAVIERRASQADLEISVPNGDAGSISLKRVPLEQLVKLRDQYRRELKSAEIAAGLADGRGSSRIIRVRFQGN